MISADVDCWIMLQENDVGKTELLQRENSERRSVQSAYLRAGDLSTRRCSNGLASARSLVWTLSRFRRLGTT